MKLYEFQISQHHPGSVRHGNAVACRHFGVRSLAIEPAGSSGCQDRSRGPDYEEVFQYPDFRVLPDFLYQCFGNYPPGFVAVSMGYARMAVAAFEGGGDPAAGQIELGSNESVSSIAEAIPPWALNVLLSFTLPLQITMTLRCSAVSRAARRPAIPAPITRQSVKS